MASHRVSSIRAEQSASRAQVTGLITRLADGSGLIASAKLERLLRRFGISEGECNSVIQYLNRDGFVEAGALVAWLFPPPAEPEAERGDRRSGASGDVFAMTLAAGAAATALPQPTAPAADISTVKFDDHPYCKSISQELFKTLLAAKAKLIDHSAFQAARGIIRANIPPDTSTMAETVMKIELPNPQSHVSEDVWHSWMQQLLAAIGKDHYLAACAASAAAIRGISPRTEIQALKNPWFDLDFSGLGNRSFRIDEVENRAITLGQLKTLEAFFLKEADNQGVLTGWWDRFSNVYKIPADKLNLYQLTDWVINPATAPYQCSYVELVSTEDRQLTSWFISHWWGEPVRDFIRCVDNHARIRGVSDSSAYWVCAYANNQHELGKDLGNDPLKSSFARAMGMARGVLLILDDVGPATPFTRIWCCFEEAVTILHLGERRAANPLLFDIATMKDGQSQLLTEGLTEDEVMQELHPDQGWIHKSKREATFPISIIREGLTVDVAEAQASQEIDKVRILNCIAGRQGGDLDSTPYDHHARYREVNGGLAGVFAIAAWRPAVEAQIDISDGGNLPLEKALREDQVRRDLTLNFAGMGSLSDGDLEAVSRSLPRQLTSLKLVFDGNAGLNSLAVLARAIGGLTELNSLFLDFAGCSGLTSGLVELGVGIAGLTGLTELTLKFNLCSGLTTGLAEVGRGLAGLRGHCCSRSGAGAERPSRTGLAGLTQLALKFYGCTGLTAGLAELGVGLAGLRGLTSLYLNFNCCMGLSSGLPELGAGLVGLAGLTRLELMFNCCLGLTSGLAELGGAIEGLPALAEGGLLFMGCPGGLDGGGEDRQALQRRLRERIPGLALSM